MYELQGKVIEIVIILQRILITQQFYAFSLYKLQIALEDSLVLLQFLCEFCLLELNLPLKLF